MQDRNCLPKIVMLFDSLGNTPNNELYREALKNTLKQVLPLSVRQLAVDDPDRLADQREEFGASLPLLFSTPCAPLPCSISFFSLSKHRLNSFKFFFDMIGQWLIPGKHLTALLCYTVDFIIPDLGQDVYTLCEIMIKVADAGELEELQRNLPIIETEVRLGMQSNYYARRILEIKGLSADAKTAMIQDYIARLISRMPRLFDQDLLTEMQHVLVTCRDEFKAARECRHLSRIISAHYLFRKDIRESVKVNPEKRYLSLKLFKASIHIPQEEPTNDADRNCEKSVLAILVGINFLRDTEVFEERHLLSAIQNYIPAAQLIKGSFLSNKRGHENICTLYLEIEKNNNEAFSPEEIRLLRRELTSDLKDRIEHLMHPIFMPRNEEEVMRNILTLSNQIKYLQDLPQIIISFDKQTHADLLFTVIIVRVMQPGSASLQEMFKVSNSFLGYIPDRSKTVGYLRKKYTKEATVFGVKLTKNQFLRRDHSIDLNKARQAVVQELTRVVGPIRDFNGGMISKQNELLCTIREQLGNDIKYNDLLLENFFYSLSPDIARTVIDPKVLKTLFVMLLESIERGFFSGENCAMGVQHEVSQVFVMIKAEERNIKELINRAVDALDYPPAKVTSAFVSVYDISYLGYLFVSNNLEEQQQFCQKINESLLNQKKRSQAHSQPQLQVLLHK